MPVLTRSQTQLIEKLDRIRSELSHLAKDIPDEQNDEIHEINFLNKNKGNLNVESYWNINESKMSEWFTEDELKSLENMGWKIWKIHG